MKSTLEKLSKPALNVFAVKQGRYEFLKNTINGELLTVLPPKTAVGGGEMLTTEKYSELAFQNCI